MIPNSITPQNNELEDEFKDDFKKKGISRFGKARSSKELDKILGSESIISPSEDNRLPVLKSQFDQHTKFQHDRSQSL